MNTSSDGARRKALMPSIRRATADDIYEAKRIAERDRQHMEEAMSDHRDFEKLFASGPFKNHGSLSALVDFNERNGLPLPESVRAMREEFECRMGGL